MGSPPIGGGIVSGNVDDVVVVPVGSRGQVTFTICCCSKFQVDRADAAELLDEFGQRRGVLRARAIDHVVVADDPPVGQT